jgi:hypothetical protein
VTARHRWLTADTLDAVRLAAGLPAALIVWFSIVSCGGRTPASELARPPEMPLRAGQTKCTVKASQAKPLIVEWSSDERGDLETLVRMKKVVPVRYDGCEMEILEHCTAPGHYNFYPFTPKVDSIAIRNEDELYAKLPLGAVNLEATLADTKRLDLSMTLIGKFQADQFEVRPDELAGRCAGATHVVTGLMVGAFRLSSGASATVGGGASTAMAGGGGQAHADTSVLQQDGDAASCSQLAPTDTAPPPGCGALIKLDVVPLDAGGGPLDETGRKLREVRAEAGPLFALMNQIDEARQRCSPDWSKDFGSMVAQNRQDMATLSRQLDQIDQLRVSDSDGQGDAAARARTLDEQLGEARDQIHRVHSRLALLNEQVKGCK